MSGWKVAYSTCAAFLRAVIGRIRRPRTLRRMARHRAARRDAGGAELKMRVSVGWAKSPAVAEMIAQGPLAILPTRSSGTVLRRGQGCIACRACIRGLGSERDASLPT